MFAAYLQDNEGNEIAHEYDGVDLGLLRHLVLHEESLADFIEQERQGRPDESMAPMENVLSSELCAGLVGPEDPVGW